MRLISNEELVFVAGGAADSGGADGEVQQVEIVGTRMSIWEKMWDSITNFFGGSGGTLSNADYAAMQQAYVYANETGNPQNVEITKGLSGEIGGDYKFINAKIQFSGSKYTVTVDPCCTKGKSHP